MRTTTRRIPRFRGYRLVMALLALLTVWAVAALYYDIRIAWLGMPAAALYAVAVVSVVLRTEGRIRGLLPWFGSLVLVMIWWFSLSPSHDRNWQPDVAQLPWTERQGDLVTVHNIRNFAYRTETDYTPHWETRRVDLAELHGVDLIVTHWGSPWIAHGTVSFQFRDKEGKDSYLAASIEQRKTVGQTYSTVRGFFRQYELIYLLLDERDVVRLRTNYREGEDVRLYRTMTTPADARRLFLQYLEWVNSLHAKPQWYNALFANCTSRFTDYLAGSGIGNFPRWDWRFVANGRGDELLYEKGYLATGGLPFPELAGQALINEAAKKLGDDPDFSRKIRQGRPGFD